MMDYRQVMKSSELLGFFVKPEVWCKIVLQNIKMSQSAGSLTILAAIIRGSDRNLVRPNLPDIVEVITDPGICHIADVSSTDGRHSEKQ